jgi:hypothetical protein
MSIFQVQRIEAQKFAQVWNKGGISMILPDVAIDFATDFSNVVLNNFIQMCQANAQAQVAANEAAKPKIIMEGIK